jgi:hypothetical protein
MLTVSESESELHFLLATSSLRPKTINFIYQLNTCVYSPYVTSSLTRGWVCRLQLLLTLASAVILGSESRGTHDHIYYLRFETPPTLRKRSPYLCPPGIGWPGYTPRSCNMMVGHIYVAYIRKIN